MGMQLALITQTFAPAEDQTWLGSAHGTNTADPITLDTALMVAAFPTGIIPSGVVIGQVAATGRFGPYDDTAVDGRAVARGHLFQTVDLTNGGLVAAAAGQNPSAALYWHGEVVEAKLPAGHGLDAAGKADLPQIRYV